MSPVLQIMKSTTRLVLTILPSLSFNTIPSPIVGSPNHKGKLILILDHLTFPFMKNLSAIRSYYFSVYFNVAAECHLDSEMMPAMKKGNLITAIRCLRNRSKSVAYWSAFALFEIKNTQRHFYPCVWYFKQKLNMKLYRSDALLLSEPFCSKHLSERNITRQIQVISRISSAHKRSCADLLVCVH